MDEEKTKGRTWNGYACPGCRTVFRVAADFIGADVMCPSCKETLRLPKTPEEVPAQAQNFVAPQAAAASVPLQEPARTSDRPQHVEPSVLHTMLSTTDGRLKLALALLLPLTLVVGALLLFPSKESTPEKVVLEDAPLVHPETTPQQKPAPPPPPVAVSEMPELPPPALPEPAETPAPEVAVVQPVPEPEAITPEIPEPVAAVQPAAAPDDGLVEAIPATPVPAPEQPAPAVMPEPETSATPAELVHTVVRGDTLSKLSQKYHVGIATIKKANAMKDDAVMLGQKLIIPGGVAPVAEEPAPPAVAETPAPAPQADRSHTVVKGDTLERIGRKYGVEPRAIMKANGMKNDVIRIGRKLVIPPARP